MHEDVKISDPKLVLENIQRVSKILLQYKDCVSNELAELPELESLISETSQMIQDKRSNLYSMIENERMQRESSDADSTKSIIVNLQRQLNRTEEHLFKVQKSTQEYQQLLQDVVQSRQLSSKLFDVSHTLSQKLERLINLIIDNK